MRSTARVGNLPHEVTSFVGRHRELADVQSLLSTSRLLTLVGPGGVGKTRLALRAADRMQREFPDGVWLVELDHVRDPVMVGPTLVGVLGLQERARISPGELLVTRLSRWKALVVLDNCEHVLPEVAKLIELLRGARHVRILVTSREALGVQDEIIVQVSPLQLPTTARAMSLDELAGYDAVALFLDRAEAVVPDFELTESNRVAIGEICAGLDGLPLAIELAAAWLPVLSPGQIRDRLGDRLALLTRGPRSAATRRQTLHQCISWSHDLCSPPGRRLWARLSVFTGSFDAAAAEAVCRDEQLPGADVAKLLVCLVDQSVLIRQEHAIGLRYRMLDSLRAYGLDRLRDAGEDVTFRRRHRDWYRSLTGRANADWISPQLAEWLARLDAELPNLRAALEFSLTEPDGTHDALCMLSDTILYWRMRGRHGEVRHWLDQALAPEGEPTADRLKALWTGMTAAASMGDVAASAAYDRGLREVAGQRGDAYSRAVVAFADALLAIAHGDLAVAAVHAKEGFSTFRAEGDVLWEAMILTSLVLTLVLLGDTAGAATHHEIMVELCRARGQSWPSGFTALSLGIGLWKEGDLESAARMTAEALPRLRPSTLNTCWCLEVMAWIAAAGGRLERAAVLLGAAEALAEAMGTRAAMWPELLTYHEQVEQETRRALGERRFRKAFARGESLPLDDAIAYALDDRGGDNIDDSDGRGDGTADLPRPAHPGVAVLTRREREVATLIAEGLSNKDIAARLVISPRTAEGHVLRIMTKLGCSSRTQLAALIIPLQPRLSERSR